MLEKPEVNKPEIWIKPEEEQVEEETTEELKRRKTGRTKGDRRTECVSKTRGNRQAGNLGNTRRKAK